MFFVIVAPLLALASAIVWAWGWGVGWVQLSLLAGMYLASGFGVTIGFHRLFSHRSFDAPRPVKWTLAILGSMATEGPLLRWVATHRRHHQHSDGEDDPHSPHHHGGGIRGILAGFWHAHIGWMFYADPPDLYRHVRDLSADPALKRISDWCILWILLGLAIPAVLGGILLGSWSGALQGFIWGGLVRICVVHHATWSINSVCHMWGARPFRSQDESRNSFLCGVLGLGEGWHNNHHAFPASARHGLRWWEIDLSYMVIWLMERFGLVYKVRVPSPASLEARRVRPTTHVSPPPAVAAPAAATANTCV